MKTENQRKCKHISLYWGGGWGWHTPPHPLPETMKIILFREAYPCAKVEDDGQAKPQRIREV